MAERLAREGNLDELRRRGDAGDIWAAHRLHYELILAKDEKAVIDLECHYANVGDPWATRSLSERLARAGDDRLQRYGFDLHGQIANGPTW